MLTSLLACAFIIALRTNASSLPKCCGKGQQLETDLTTCTRTSDVSFFPEDVGFLSSKTYEPIPIGVDVNIRYDSKPQCEVEIVPFTNSITLFDNGSLLMENNVNFTFKSDSYCMDRVFIDRSMSLYRNAPRDHTFVILLCPCMNSFCVRKCCIGDRILNVSSREGHLQADCVDYTSSQVWQPRINGVSEYFINHGIPYCPAGVYLLNKSASKSSYFISADESFQFDESKIPADEYCTDRSLVNGELTDNVLACLKPPPVQLNKRAIFYAILFVLGSMFLLVTLLLHLWLPELRKSVHSFNLMMHVASLFIGYISLAVGNFELIQTPSVLCIFLAYLIQFSFLAAFFWLNVLCIDISWTFSGLRVMHGTMTPAKESRKCMLYSVYAWGSTALVSAITALIDYTPIIPQHAKLKPNFGDRICWFKNPESTIVYFYGPIGIILFFNLLLFLFTATKIHLARKDTSILHRDGSSRHNSHEEQHRFLLYLKLFSVMGVTWTFEIVSWSVYQSEAIWYITDFINVLRGLFIFLLFCAKKNVFYILKSKFSDKKNISRSISRSLSRTLSSM